MSGPGQGARADLRPHFGLYASAAQDMGHADRQTTTAPGVDEAPNGAGCAVRRGLCLGPRRGSSWRVSSLALVSTWCVHAVFALPPQGRVLAAGLRAQAGLSAATLGVGLKRFGNSLSSSGKRALVRPPLMRSAILPVPTCARARAG